MNKLGICNSALARIGEPSIPSLDPDVTRADTCNMYYDEARQLMLSEHWWNFAAEKVILKPVYVAMTSIADSGGLVRVNRVAHGLTTGDRVRNKDTQQFDGPYFITTLSADAYTLDDSTYNASGVAGSYTKIPKFDGCYQAALPADCIHVRAVDGYDFNLPEQVWRVVGRNLHFQRGCAHVFYTMDVEDTDLFPPNFNECLALKLAYFLAGVLGDDPSKKQETIQELESIAISKAIRNNSIEKRRDDSMQTQLYPATDARSWGFPGGME